jgi:hypothetical protein
VRFPRSTRLELDDDLLFGDAVREVDLIDESGQPGRAR